MKQYLKTASLLALTLLILCQANARAASVGSPSAASGSQRDLLAQLRQATGGKVQLAYHGQTGQLRFLGTDRAHAVSRPQGVSPQASPEAAARAFLNNYGALFGATADAKDLTVTDVSYADQARSFVRFQQRANGVPVLGGELMVQLDGERNMLSANGELLPNISTGVVASIKASAARAEALAATVAAYGGDVSKYSASTPSLSLFNPSLLGGPGLHITSLVWRVEVTGAQVRELVLVDALKGKVALQFNQIAHAKERRVCDKNNVIDATPNTTDDDCPAAQYARVEGQGPTGNAEVDLAFDYSGTVYDYFANNFGRDSLDNRGLPLESIVRYCPDAQNCPYENAFWDGARMVYGDGYASADDVVGHELSHGFTDFESELYYYYQSGAINESLSDVFGEFYDLTNGAGGDGADVRWLVGEDLPIGAIRNMQNPPADAGGSFPGSPDRVLSPLYWTRESDQGGVHINSGVNNKAAYLMTDGATFNNVTVTGIGIEKAQQIYYEAANNLLLSASDYQDLYNLLQQACTTKIGSNGITAADCAQVKNALDAVEMNAKPVAYPTEAAICEPGLAPLDLFFDNLENSQSGNWTIAGNLPNSNGWYNPGTEGSPDFGRFATSGVNNFWGYPDDPDTTDATISMNRDITLPPNAFMHFRHSFDFQVTRNSAGAVVDRFDGGRVEFSVDGGATYQDAGPVLTDNGYNGTIRTAGTNPLRGQGAFTDRSFGYTASRANLSSLNGQNVRFRFRLGTGADTDPSLFDRGWFIDDIRVYTCASPTASVLGGFSAEATADGVSLQWYTGSEQNVYGWDLMRSTDGTRETATKLTAQTILAQGNGGGATYAWVDTTAVRGQSYTYWLVETDLNGAVTEHGPFTATPTAEVGAYRVFLPLVRR